MRPAEDTVERRGAIPGVGRSVVKTPVAEIGTDLTRFLASSVPSRVNHRVEALQFAPGILRGERPIDGGRGSVA